jgi:hypothetical protein
MLKVIRKEGSNDNIGTYALHEYFNRVIAHSWAITNTTNTAFCYCSFSEQDPPITFRDVIRVTITSTPGSCFFDDPNNGLRSRTWVHDPSSDWIRIDVPSLGQLLTIGFYNTVSHVLIATDWVHSARSEGAIHEIARALGWKNKNNENQSEDLPIRDFLLLGADPEWEVWNLERREIERPSEDYDTFVGELGEVGLDGSGDVSEARPYPTPNPRELYRRIRWLVEEWERRTDSKACLSGHTYAVGCHVHVGARDGYVLSGDFQEFVDVVDRHVGFLLALSGSARGSYRQRRAWRSQPWGVEYRTLPSAILAIEEVAVWAFSVVKAVALSEPIPERTKVVRSGIVEIRKAIKDGHPFSFDLVKL